MKYPVILFDADGVLIKSQYQFSERLEAEYGIPRENVRPFFAGAFKECSLGKADLKEELAKVVKVWGWKGTVDELMHFWFTKGTVMDQDVAEYIRELRRSGVRTYMVTGQEKYRGEQLRGRFGHGKLFDEVFFSAELGCTKDDPAFFTTVYKAIGDIPKDQVLFVDDSEKFIEVGKQFGFATHLFTELDGLKEKLLEHID